jgi:hypothetical protein
MCGLVRAQKKLEQARDTHKLKSEDKWTSQNIKGVHWQVSKGHPLPKEHRKRDMLEYSRNLSEQGALTS